MSNCSECERLEKEYESTLVGIRAIVNRRYGNMEEKIRDLRGMQDLRDRALASLYSHTKGHSLRRMRRIAGDETDLAA